MGNILVVIIIIIILSLMQVKQRTGQDSYNGIRDCFQKILKKEGWRAFWKGGPGLLQ